jgi:hypothetical protein
MKPNSMPQATFSAIIKRLDGRAIRAVVCVAVFASTGCATTIWDQQDPEYNRLASIAQTQCHGDEIVGVWVTRTQERIGLASMRLTMLIRPDGTGRMRRDGKDLGDFTWAYNGGGLWNGTPTRIMAGMVGPDQQFLPFTMKYAEHSLLTYSKFQAGIFGLGSVIQSRIVFARANDEAAVQQALKKRF